MHQGCGSSKVPSLLLTVLSAVRPLAMCVLSSCVDLHDRTCGAVVAVICLNFWAIDSIFHCKFHSILFACCWTSVLFLIDLVLS